MHSILVCLCCHLLNRAIHSCIKIQLYNINIVSICSLKAILIRPCIMKITNKYGSAMGLNVRTMKDRWSNVHHNELSLPNQGPWGSIHLATYYISYRYGKSASIYDLRHAKLRPGYLRHEPRTETGHVVKVILSASRYAVRVAETFVFCSFIQVRLHTSSNCTARDD